MRHFHRTSLTPSVVMATAEQFFAALGLTAGAVDARSRSFSGALGAMDAKIDFKSLIDQASKQVEKAVLEALFQRKDYGITELSDLLDLDTKSLRKKLSSYGIGKYGADPKA